MGQDPGWRIRLPAGRKNPAGKSSGVGGKGGSRETYRVASKPSGVSGEGGSCEAYGVVETPRGDRQGVVGVVESP